MLLDDFSYAPETTQLYSLDDQIRHKADFMRQYMLLPGRPPLVVAAHSIGAYVAVHAVRDVEQQAGMNKSGIQVGACIPEIAKVCKSILCKTTSSSCLQLAKTFQHPELLCIY